MEANTIFNMNVNYILMAHGKMQTPMLEIVIDAYEDDKAVEIAMKYAATLSNAGYHGFNLYTIKSDGNAVFYSKIYA